jgi:hypothetical protein
MGTMAKALTSGSAALKSHMADEVERCSIVSKDMIQLNVGDGWGDE